MSDQSLDHLQVHHFFDFKPQVPSGLGNLPHFRAVTPCDFSLPRVPAGNSLDAGQFLGWNLYGLGFRSTNCCKS